MEYTTLTPEVREPQVLEPKPSQSLYEICQQVVDGRAARGKQYDLAGLLMVLVMAKLAGMKSLLGESRLGARSANAVVRRIAVVLETDAVC